MKTTCKTKLPTSKRHALLHERLTNPYVTYLEEN